jgi:predicted transcriptional regulator
MKLSKNGRSSADGRPTPAAPSRPSAPEVHATAPVAPPERRSTVAKVSHTLDTTLARRLETFAFFQRVSESAVIEHALSRFFELSDKDDVLGEMLRKSGAGRRRKV